MIGPIRLPDSFDWGELQVVCDPEKTMPQALADAMAAEVVRAVEWFHDPDDAFLGDPTVRSIPDWEVAERVVGWQNEYAKEVNRYNRGMPPQGVLVGYVLVDLPFERQRALVERWERLWRDWLEANPDWVCEPSGGFVHKRYGYTGGPDGLVYLEGLRDTYRGADEYESYDAEEFG